MDFQNFLKQIIFSGQIGLSDSETAAQFISKTKLELFEQAFTHSSYANEHQLTSNERLEFLGDSVLAVIVCQFLFEKYPADPEGDLAKLKAVIVSAPYLAEFSLQLGLNCYLKLGQGEIRSNGQNKPNILADLFEAFIGALFLSFGFDSARQVVLPLLNSVLPEVIAKIYLIDAKSSLQEVAQARGIKPEYRLIKEEGPPHNRRFTVEVLLDNRVLGTGAGRSLKEAQNQAALNCLSSLQKGDSN